MPPRSASTALNTVGFDPENKRFEPPSKACGKLANRLVNSQRLNDNERFQAPWRKNGILAIF